MKPEEVKQAEEVIGAVLKGTGDLQPLKAAFPDPMTPGPVPNDVQTCSPDHPMPKGAPGRWEHTNVVEDGDQTDGYPGGDIQRYRCLDCGHMWKEELPQ